MPNADLALTVVYQDLDLTLTHNYCGSYTSFVGKSVYPSTDSGLTWTADRAAPEGRTRKSSSNSSFAEFLTSMSARQAAGIWRQSCRRYNRLLHSRFQHYVFNPQIFSRGLPRPKLLCQTSRLFPSTGGRKERHKWVVLKWCSCDSFDTGH